MRALLAVLLAGLVLAVWLVLRSNDALPGALPRSRVELEPSPRREAQLADPRSAAERQRVEAAAQTAAAPVRPAPLADDARVFGIVIDARTRAPIADVLVELRAGTLVERAQRATTARDGRFEFGFASAARPHLHARAEGYGARLADPAGHADPSDPLRIELARAAALLVLAVDDAAVPVPGVGLSLTAQASDLMLGEGGFFMREHLRAPDGSWSAVTGADGRAVLEDLPAEVELESSVDWKGGPARLAPDRLTLAPGERREVRLRLGGGTRISGAALDQHGRALEGQGLVLAACNLDPMLRALQLEQSVARMRTSTDGLGRFAFDAVEPGCWRISTEGGDVAMLPLQIETAGEPEHAVTLRASRSLWIPGVVLDPGGQPVADTRVEAYADEQMFWSGTRSDESGRFRLGPVTADTFTLIAYGSSGLASSDALAARAGDSGLVLRLKRAGSLSGRVVDGSGAAQAAQLRYTPEQRGFGPFGDGALLETDSDGRFALHDLAPGRYGLSAMSSDGRFALQHGLAVAAGGSTRAVELVLAPGGKLVLHNAGQAAQLYVGVVQSGTPVHFGARLARGGRTTLLVPAGELVLELRTDPLGPARTLAARVAAGATVELELGD